MEGPCRQGECRAGAVGATEYRGARQEAGPIWEALGVPPLREQNLALLTRLYDGLQSSSTEGILGVLGPSVVIRMTGAGDLDGVFRGRAEAQAFYARVMRMLGPGFKVPPYDILVSDASLVVVPRGSTFGDAGHGLDVYHFEDGLISEAWLTVWKVDQPNGRPTHD